MPVVPVASRYCTLVPVAVMTDPSGWKLPAEITGLLRTWYLLPAAPGHVIVVPVASCWVLVIFRKEAEFVGFDPAMYSAALLKPSRSGSLAGAALVEVHREKYWR